MSEIVGAFVSTELHGVAGADQRACHDRTPSTAADGVEHAAAETDDEHATLRSSTVVNLRIARARIKTPIKAR